MKSPFDKCSCNSVAAKTPWKYLAQAHFEKTAKISDFEYVASIRCICKLYTYRQFILIFSMATLGKTGVSKYWYWYCQGLFKYWYWALLRAFQSIGIGIGYC